MTFGRWMWDRAFERIGHLYPKVELPASEVGARRTCPRATEAPLATHRELLDALQSKLPSAVRRLQKKARIRMGAVTL